MKAKEILVKAREILSDPANWTQNDYAKNKAGNGVLPNSEEATCFCALGAVCKVVGSEDENADDAAAAVRFLEMAAPDYDVPEFNDACETKHEDVLELFDRAIKKADNAEDDE